MTNPLGWSADEPCPDCGGWDITEWEFRRAAEPAAVVVRMAWECRDCGYLARWTISPRVRKHTRGGDAA